MRQALGAALLLLGIAGIMWLAWWPRGQDEATPEVTPVVAVRTATVARRTLHRYVVAYGTVEPAPAGGGRPGGGSKLAAPVSGVVTRVLCAEGARVEAGAVMFQLDARVADASVEKAREEVKFAELAVARERRLLPAGGASQKSVEAAEQALATAQARQVDAEVQEALLRVKAPFSGVVTRVNVRPGEAVESKTILAELIDTHHLVVVAGLPVAELDGLALGARAQILAGDRPPVETVLTYVSAELDPVTGLDPVRAAVPDGAGLLPGQFARLRVVREVAQDQLTVPEQSVVRPEPGACAVSIVEGDLARRVPVTCGIQEGGMIAIAGPAIREGVVVVSGGAYGIPAESRVRVLPP